MRLSVLIVYNDIFVRVKRVMMTLCNKCSNRRFTRTNSKHLILGDHFNDLQSIAGQHAS